MDFPTFVNSLSGDDQYLLSIIYGPRVSHFSQGMLIPREIVKGILWIIYRPVKVDIAHSVETY